MDYVSWNLWTKHRWLFWLPAIAAYYTRLEC